MFRFCQRRVFTVPPFSFCRPQQQNSTKKPIGSDDCVEHLTTDAGGGLDTVQCCVPGRGGRVEQHTGGFSFFGGLGVQGFTNTITYCVPISTPFEPRHNMKLSHNERAMYYAYSNG